MNCSFPLDSAFLARTAPVMRDRGNVLDKFDKNASGLERGNSTLSPRSWSIYMDTNFLYAKFRRFFRCLLRRTLASKRRTLSASLKPTRTGACPTERVAFCICDGHSGVIKGRTDVSNGDGDVSSRSTFLSLGHGNRRSSIENSTGFPSHYLRSCSDSPDNR